MYQSLLKNKIEYNMMSGSTSFSSAYDDVLPKELTQANFRRGKWTVEEENYTSRIIKDFENGASFFSFEEQSAVLTIPALMMPFYHLFHSTPVIIQYRLYDTFNRAHLIYRQ